jgi:ABC-type molybdate transport system substrate-binding protein
MVSLQNNGGDQITLSSNGPFTFDQSLGTGSIYAVTVSGKPTAQTCLVTNGSGTVANSNVTSIQVTCSVTTSSIGGTVYGLSGSGLVLQDNGGDNLSVNADGSFTFISKIEYGNPYAVSVATQPSNPTQACRVPNGSGSAYANISGIQVVCTNGAATTNLWTER